jgi:Protein of unknown function (DUF3311)
MVSISKKERRLRDGDGHVRRKGMGMNGSQKTRAALSGRWKWLLAIPFVVLLWVPSYNAIEPSLWGFPFFYWYQFLWLFLSAALIIWLHHRTD